LELISTPAERSPTRFFLWWSAASAANLARMFSFMEKPLTKDQKIVLTVGIVMAEALIVALVLLQSYAR